MHTILGAGGAIGIDLAKVLAESKQDIRLVSRKPSRVNPGDQLHPADLLDAGQVLQAVEGSAVCYLTAGLPYKAKLWKEAWPVMIKNVVEACAAHGARLVFFDNVYAVDKAHIGHIKEDSPLDPVSKKGEVRAWVDRYLLEQVEKGRIEAIIARSPDFYGAVKANSVLMTMVYDNLLKGKKPQWLCSADMPHTMGYVPDMARGTALLGQSKDAWNQVWNLPVDAASPTGREWAELFAEEMGGPRKIQVLPGWGIRLLGLFIPIMGEIYEMRYQYDRPYIFDSSKFDRHFGYAAKGNAKAVREVVIALGKPA